MQTIFVFGNPLVEEDLIAIKIAEELKKTKKFPNLKFKKIDSLGDLKTIPKELIILDCAEGIKKIEIINDLELLAREKKFSLHDFDLGAELLLLEKIGKLKSVEIKIIAVPKKIELKRAVARVKAILLSKSALHKKYTGHMRE